MRADDEASLVGVLNRAFDSDTIFEYVQPEKARRARVVAQFHKASVHYARQFGVADVAPQSAGLALWLPPGAEQLTLPRMLQTGFGKLALSLGATLPRLLRVDSQLSQMHKAHAPGRHWYLFLLGVDPAFHGQGVGSQLLEQGVARARVQELPIYLETQTEANVAFYTRRGFTVQEQRILAPGLTTWALTKE